MENDIIVGLDIGTTKIACFIGQACDNGKVKILGYGRTESVGVERGVVMNIKETANSIRKAVRAASEQAGVDVKEVYVGVAGQHIKSLQNTGSITIKSPDHIVTQADVDQMIEDQYNVLLEPGEEIIHVFPQSYEIDDDPLCVDGNKYGPAGVVGSCLKAKFHVVIGNTLNVQKIRTSVIEAGYEVKEIVLEPIASACAVLDDQERTAGALLVDIGGGTTDVAIFYDGVIRHTSVLALAGNVISQDIRLGCNIMREQAELLKVKFGSCLPTNVNANDVIAIPGIRRQQPKEINMKFLAEIIHNRTQQILELVNYELSVSQFQKRQLIGGVVLTGGGSQLKHIQDLCSLTIAMPTRIGTPDEHIDDSTDSTILEVVKHPMYATGIGLVLYGINQEKHEAELEAQKAKDATPQEDQPVEKETEDSFNGMEETPVEESKTDEPEDVEKEIDEDKKGSGFMRAIHKFLNKVMNEGEDESEG